MLLYLIKINRKVDWGISTKSLFNGKVSLSFCLSLSSSDCFYDCLEISWLITHFAGFSLCVCPLFSTMDVIFFRQGGCGIEIVGIIALMRKEVQVLKNYTSGRYDYEKSDNDEMMVIRAR